MLGTQITPNVKDGDDESDMSSNGFDEMSTPSDHEPMFTSQRMTLTEIRSKKSSLRKSEQMNSTFESVTHSCLFLQYLKRETVVLIITS